jgi:acetyl esterase/lipase
MVSFRLLVLLLAASVNSNSFGDEPIVLPLWPDRAPGETDDIGPEQELPARGTKPVIRLTNVSKPTITVYTAPKDKANGCAVVVCPGGGYSILAMDLEGTEVAEWLNTLGVTAIVLKYRVPRRKGDPENKVPLQDAQRAIRLVRRNAQDWNIDPARLGVLGFSAGGHLTVRTGLEYDRPSYEKVDAADDQSCKPDFLCPIYAAYLGDPKDDTRLNPDLRINKETPPMFLAVTYDDKARAIHAALLLVELKKVGVPAELHIYSRGGHGYGLRPSDLPVSTWRDRCGAWLKTSGWLEKR